MESVDLTDDMLPERYKPTWNELEKATSEALFVEEQHLA